MNTQEFINAIKLVVHQQSVADTISNLEDPPGRQPPKELLELSGFYKSLDEVQKGFLLKIINMASDTTLFGLLCVLDGVRAIEDSEEKGELKLIFRKDGVETLLNNPDEAFLHDMI